MDKIQLEHVNVSVADADAIAHQLVAIFAWKIRWQGASKEAGYTVHVGNESCYVALYQPHKLQAERGAGYANFAFLNHIGVTVPNLDAVKHRLQSLGIEITSEDNVAPGSRCYFPVHGIEIEVVEY